ncbi:MAG: adenosylcobinamide-GDP ribazoletransferase [Rhodoferax sp.]|uniref:adenosylcobinamide-GDP ribazoletransferase n=1 Tax=Rhodoferax sp. TaxID=50421 RepID=UPI003016004A
MPHFLQQFIRHYLLAVQFFTRIPVTGRLADWVGYSPAMLRASAAHFPGVGWLVGGLVSAFSALLLLGLPDGGYSPLVVAALGTALGVLITGAFHEDGLADVADGLGGSLDRERALIIMKDSRVGAFGAIAVVLALLTKVSLLALLGSVSSLLMCLALFWAHVVSRTWPLLLIRFMPHVGDAAGSKSKPLADQIAAGSLGVAFIWCFMALALAVYAQVAMNIIAVDDDLLPLLKALAGALGASALAFGVMWRWFWTRLQGFTGDCLGTTQQVCEIAFYLGLALSL